MIKSLKDRLIEVLINNKLITKEDLQKAVDKQKEKSGSLSKILIESGLVKEKDLMVVWGQELDVPLITLSRYNIDKELVKLIPERIAKSYNLIAISKFGNRLSVAMSDPLNILAADDIRVLTGLEIDPVIATENDIKEAINASYGSEASNISELAERATGDEVTLVEIEAEKIDIDEMAQESGQAPIVKLVDLIIGEAIKRRASDIHIEPEEKDLRIRYRVDGVLHDVFKIPKKNQNAVIARLKIMSKLDITESRLPQDGRFKIRMEKKEIDFRVSVLPITYGGKIVLRALDKANLSIGLDQLGFLPEPLRVFQEAIKKPFGMILITGPTGSGKSTTLYSIVSRLNTPERNIITIEDPVEYQVDGITQVHVLPEIGLTFANGLKSILRQSPDVIMIGEIRDSETADIAVKAALTGELVFSTLHTNDATGAVTRLIDMGVEPFLVASSVIMVGAQRLCRKICPHCKEEYDIPKSVLERVGIVIPRGEKKPFYHGKGCAKCNKTGYLGRIAILEAVAITDEIREMITSRASSDKIKKFATEKQGMKLLRDNGITQFINGVTTLEEVLRITSEE
ncbi:MAG: secretion system protein E [Candidatus Omnitrophica bacterium CG07_land_8_20_14_0_80_42_15]|uniref:Secretion system protein E n=1 Tax=Candidatus Aquitaenariimonas noxiae TaxID=1974741 RepID=A0A2J0KUY7_9BACT|nr:MAG: secretion system protein E [Candidatus Omnitrophica bacterium CG07_land_8_20_14_0_80_42_15]